MTSHTLARRTSTRARAAAAPLIATAGLAGKTYSCDGKPVAAYWLEKAWPSKMDLARLKAGAADLVASVTMPCEHIQRVAP